MPATILSTSVGLVLTRMMDNCLRGLFGPFLDYRISNEKWWRIVLWRRLFPNLSWEDIMMRMQPELGSRTEDSDTVKRNSLNMQCCRTFNVKYSMVSWHLKGARGKPRKTVLDALSDWQKDNNTTRGSTPGLIHTALGDIPGNRVYPPQVNEKEGTRVRGGRQSKRKAAELEDNVASEDTPSGMSRQNANSQDAGFFMGGGIQIAIEDDHGNGRPFSKKRRSNRYPGGPRCTTHVHIQPHASTDGPCREVAEQEYDKVSTAAADQQPSHFFEQFGQASAFQDFTATSTQPAYIPRSCPTTRIDNPCIGQARTNARFYPQPSTAAPPSKSWVSVATPLTGMSNQLEALAEGFNAGQTHLEEAFIPSLAPPIVNSNTLDTSLDYAFDIPEQEDLAFLTSGTADPWSGFQYVDAPRPLNAGFMDHGSSSMPAYSTGHEFSVQPDWLLPSFPPAYAMGTSHSDPITRHVSPQMQTTSFSAPPSTRLQDGFDWELASIDPNLVENLEFDPFELPR
ncbi:MAG: hypothetical protein Q9217_000836 [Psora testacea]